MLEMSLLNCGREKLFNTRDVEYSKKVLTEAILGIKDQCEAIG